MFYFDPIYFVFLLPGILLAGYAALTTKMTFARYAKVRSKRGYTGAEAAAEMLRGVGVTGVAIERVRGSLTDHYDPRSRTLRLSDDVYASPSIAAIGVACHEAGHAIQHARGYAMLHLRSALVPVTNFCSTLYVWVIMLGAIMAAASMIKIGIWMCGVAVLFSVVTLPVEWDASARAKEAMLHSGFLTPQETASAGKVLNAAFLTYLASAVTSILTLLYYLYRYGLIGNRR